MRSAVWREWALLAGLALPALSVLWNARLYASADGALHLYRLVQFDRLLRAGVFYTRWWPDLAYGFGFPLLNYYAPLAYYLTAPFTLVGAPFALALNLSLLAALAVGTAGVYVWVSALDLSPSGADVQTFLAAPLLAAVSYLYAPYILWNAFYRANLAEAWALGLSPWALWAYTRLASRPTLGRVSLAAALHACVLLSHNVTGLFFTALAAGYAAFLSFRLTILSPRPFPVGEGEQVSPSLEGPRSPKRSGGEKGGRGLSWSVSLLLALGLSAFFWLPALSEQGYVQLERVMVTPDFDYRYHFIAPGELAAPLPQAETGRLNPEWPETAGLAQILLALAGVAFLALRPSPAEVWGPLLALALAALALVGLMHSLSAPLWERLPFLSFVQHPGRLRGVLALALAALAGAAAQWAPGRGRALVGIGTAVLVALSSFSLLFPRLDHQAEAGPTLETMFAYERRSGALGTTSFGEYLPVWVQVAPDRSPLEAQYATRDAPDRWVWPEGVRVLETEAAPGHAWAQVEVAREARVVYRAFYFPGWRVEADGQPAALLPTARDGLISFNLPVGAHRLAAYYAGTSMQHAAAWISLLGALMVGGLALAAAWRRRVAGALYLPGQSSLRGGSQGRRSNPMDGRRRSEIASSARQVRWPPRNDGGSWLLAALLLAVPLAKVYADRAPSPWVVRWDPAQPAAVAPRPVQARFEGELVLLGAADLPDEARRGGEVEVRLYWQAQRPLERDYAVAVHLVDGAGALAAQSDRLHPGGLPVRRWDPAGYVLDTHLLMLPETLPPGEYTLLVLVHDPVTNRRLQVGGAEGLTMGRILVR